MEGDVITQWGPNVTLKSPAILVRRDSLKTGDVVHSSHYGRGSVHEFDVRGATVFMRLSGMPGPESYPADSLIPSYTAYEAAAAEQRELLETAALSKTLRDREATAYHTGHDNGRQEGIAWALEEIQEAYSLAAVATTIGAELRRLQRQARR